jgi:transposase InsO family protein
VRPVFERLFREYGLPRAIRTDNGVPFATTGIHGLSQLNVWWLGLGIQHQRILPAHPQQNGAHERMHKTLKGDAIRPPRATLVLQQRAFTAFRRLYNDERPHQALGGRLPASVFRPSPRTYPTVLPPIEYPGHFIVKRVANALKQHPIGIEEVDDGIWSIAFCRVLLGRIDERDYIVQA